MLIASASFLSLARLTSLGRQAIDALATESKKNITA